MVFVLLPSFVKFLVAALEDTRQSLQQTVSFVLLVAIVLVDLTAVDALKFHRLVEICSHSCYSFWLKRLVAVLHRAKRILTLHRSDTRFTKVLLTVFILVHNWLQR